MANIMKFGSWIILALTSIAAAFAGRIVYGLQSGTLDGPGAGFTLLFLTLWLGIFSVLSLIVGVRGYLKAKRSKSHTPLDSSLNAVIGALGILLLAYIGTH